MYTDSSFRSEIPGLKLKSVFIGAPSAALFLALFFAVAGCGRADGGGQVVLYTSVDEPVARPILDEFTRRTGIRVSIQADTEANKSAGLVARLEAEKGNPKADVWWGNEVFRTIRLADVGVLAAYESPSAKDIPPLFKDPAHRWAGSALRARVIGVHSNPEKLSIDPLPNRSILDLLRPELKGRVAIANPRAGTTSGHVAALYVLWGQEKATQYFRDLRANGVKVLGGNGDVAAEVARGTVWAGLTDNDDVDNMAREGGAIRMVLPDQATFGTLAIPCTTGLVAGGKSPDAAKKLIDYLLSAEVENRMIELKFARYSVRDGAGAEQVTSMRVNYAEVAKVLPRAANSAEAILVGRE
jgi:iron(III) transport system substrate-binding protein